MSRPTPRSSSTAQYRALREEAGFVDRSERGKLLRPRPRRRRVPAGPAHQRRRGARRRARAATRPCSTARATCRPTCGSCDSSTDEFWLDTEPAPAERLAAPPDTYRVGREVEIADDRADGAILSRDRAGRRASSPASRASRPSTPSASCERRRRRGAAPSPPTSGVDLICRPADGASALRAALAGAGARGGQRGRRRDPPGRVRASALRPRDERRDDARRGRDRRARRRASRRAATSGRRRWRASTTRASQPPPPRAAPRARPSPTGDRRVSASRERGRIGTAVVSPALGPIALAVIRREAEPGSRSTVGEPASAPRWSALPFRGAAGGAPSARFALRWGRAPEGHVADDGRSRCSGSSRPLAVAGCGSSDFTNEPRAARSDRGRGEDRRQQGGGLAEQLRRGRRQLHGRPTSPKSTVRLALSGPKHAIHERRSSPASRARSRSPSRRAVIGRASRATRSAQPGSSPSAPRATELGQQAAAP